ncbi:MAG TPA: ABC transporter permease [Cyclobacteriaceae bacterium]|nr:ABC transporter permease [Cyclobacteriaceae bacterium]
MKNSSPPEWALRFLQWICPDHLLEEIEGDLIQKFNKDLRIAGEEKAKKRFVWNTIRFFRPEILFRNKISAKAGQLPMFKNYFKTSYRHILNSKLNFVFKLGGLTITVLSFLIIAIYISFQHSFDRYHNDFENIYRINSERKENGKQERYAIVPLALSTMMQGRFPEVAALTRYRGSNQRFIRYNQKVFSCDIPQVDSSFFNVFTVQFVAGSKDALKKPKSIVLTRSLAARIFGDADPLNQFVTLTNGNQLFQVTAIIEDFPGNSHLTAEALIPIESSLDNFSASNIISPVDFVDQSTVLYARFRNHINPDLFSMKLESMVDNHMNKKVRIENGFHISLQSLDDIYLSPSLKYEFTRKGSIFYVYAFSVLGIFLLIIGSVNYINLSIADFNGRWREIGIRKVMGARKIQIVFQVVIETFLYVSISLMLGIFFLYTLFPNVLELVDSNLRFDMLFNNEVVVTVGVAMLILIALSTLIPYLQLSGPSISMNLSGAQSAGYKSSLGKTLLAVQFIISVFCISATIIVGRQLSFIHTKDLGFDRKDLIVILVPDDFSVCKMQSLKNEIKRIPGVEAVSNSSFKVGGGYWKDWYTIEVDGQMKSMELYEVFSDDELFSTLKMKLVDGRLFNANNPADSSAAFVINETAANVLGWKDPVGKRILTHPEEPGRWEGTVVGVVKDINISPLYEKVQPLVMRLPWQKDYPEYFVYVRLNGPVNKTLKAIERKYGELLPGFPFEYDDVDTFFNSRYQRENKAFGSLIFTTIIILIVSSIGIFSLSIYLSTRRMKEFGIRKVLGANIGQIMVLHIWHFIKVALLSNIISIPITYWLMKEWLNGFAYRTELSVFIFLSVMGISFLLVILSGGYSAWKAGRMNPVDVIKIQ